MLHSNSEHEVARGLPGANTLEIYKGGVPWDNRFVCKTIPIQISPLLYSTVGDLPCTLNNGNVAPRPRRSPPPAPSTWRVVTTNSGSVDNRPSWDDSFSNSRKSSGVWETAYKSFFGKEPTSAYLTGGARRHSYSVMGNRKGSKSSAHNSLSPVLNRLRHGPLAPYYVDSDGAYPAGSDSPEAAAGDPAEHVPAKDLSTSADTIPIGAPQAGSVTAAGSRPASSTGHDNGSTSQIATVNKDFGSVHTTGETSDHESPPAVAEQAEEASMETQQQQQQQQQQEAHHAPWLHGEPEHSRPRDAQEHESPPATAASYTAGSDGGHEQQQQETDYGDEAFEDS